MSAQSEVLPTPTERGDRYRGDIQGLRAFAVLAVMVFHARLPLPGGFLGVDIFFVISGYVITDLILRRAAGPRGMSWPHFYVRRFMRLAPALSAALIFTLIASYFVSSPFGIQQATAATAAGAVLLSANIVLANLAGDYFSAPAQFNPLLHTWSLSVEEQIYLLVPALSVLLVLILRWGLPRALKSIFLVVGSASLVVTLGADVLPAILVPTGGYFSASTRLWEFAAGGIVVCFGARLALGRRAAAAVGAAGLIAVTASVALLDESGHYPGIPTLVPVAGAAAVMWAGQNTTGRITRLLGDRRLVWIGDRSYSLYLWHWPVVAFALALWPVRWYAAPLATVASLVPALLLYRFVENPIRRLPTPSARALMLMALGFAGVPLVAALLLARSADAEWRSRSDDLPFGGIELTDVRHVCPPDVRTQLGSASDPDLFCEATGPSPALVVLGDSHAAALQPGFAAVGMEESFLSVGLSATPFSDPRYQPIFRFLAASLSVTDVVITSAWQFQGIDQPTLRKALGELAAGGKRVHVLSDVPMFVGDAMRCIVRRLPIGDDTCSVPVNQVRDDFRPIVARLRTLESRQAGISVIDTSEYLCGPDYCSMVVNGVPVYADYHHVNPAGARVIVSRLIEDEPNLRRLLRQTHQGP